MLILPLHRAPTRRDFPFATAMLVLANVFVFVFLQSGDERAREVADRFHVESGLAAIEVPLYLRHLATEGDARLAAQFEALPENESARWLAHALRHDRTFRARLAQGELFETPESRNQWGDLDRSYRTLRARIVTERFALDAQAPDLVGLIGSMFLHGHTGHLVGNLIFLAALGLLVELALGAWRFLALYLLSGMGAGLAWLAWQGGQPAMLVGASGAIAGLMGALAVVWGLRRIRFFYWFFVVFDYVRAPALWLLPAWLGWEVLQLLLLPESRIAYAAHAGGMLCGAALGAGFRLLGWVRFDRLEERPAGPMHEDVFARAMTHLGRLQLVEAESLLAPLAQADPRRLDVALARYRVARYAGDGGKARLVARAEDVLRAQQVGARGLDEQWETLRDLHAAGGKVTPSLRLALARRLAEHGDGAAAIALLASVADDEDEDAVLPGHWLRVGASLERRGELDLASQAWRTLVERHAHSAEAASARVLLSDQEPQRNAERR